MVLTRREEGVQNPEIQVDVLCTRPPKAEGAVTSPRCESIIWTGGASVIITIVEPVSVTVPLLPSHSLHLALPAQRIRQE